MGLKEPGLRGSLRNVSVGIDAIPDSVEYQYVAENFASPWPDEVGDADMSVNGLGSSTFSNGENSVNGDGSSDDGTADGPQTLSENQSFGIGITAEYSSVSSGDAIIAVSHGFDPVLTVRIDSSDGEIRFRVSDDNGNRLRIITDNGFADGNPHLIVLNKTGDSASDMDIYVDNMETAESVTVDDDDNFDHTNVTMTADMGFWNRNDGGTLQSDNIAMDAGIFEFKTTAYSEDERKNLKSRRPEV